ncbi:MAG: rhomboid family intramembrane serine protease [bacterium]
MYFFFFYPVGAESTSMRRPLGTLLLLALLVGVYSLRYFDPALYLHLLRTSFHPSEPDLRAALLSLFLHGGWLHLGGNALYLWIFGRQLEERLGLAPLVLLFLGGGVAACWSQALLTPAGAWTHSAPLIGASGSIAAILGATLLRFPHVRVRVLWVLFALLGGLTKGGVAYVPTGLACVFWFVLQFVYGLVAWGNGGSATAYAAHGGGFLVGVAIGVLFGFPAQARREVHRERARRYFERGDWHAAAGELTEHLQFVPTDRESRSRRARCWVVLGRTGEAATEYQRAFRDAARAGETHELAELHAEMRRYGVGTGLGSRELLRFAFDLQKAGEAEAACGVYEEITNRFPEGPLAELAVIRRAEVLWAELGDYDRAQADYTRLIELYPSSEWKDLAEARLRSMRALTGSSSALLPRGTSTRSPRPAAHPPTAS